MNAQSVLIGLALALVAAPMSGAYHPHSLNVQAESVHGYFGPGDSGRIVWDGHKVATGVYDGDTENGLGTARFVVSAADATYGCTNDLAEVPHHGNYEVWAQELVGGSIVYSAGSEGADWTSIGECISNGIISDDTQMDPNDCGSGATGVYDVGVIWRPATVVANTATAPPCGSFDGDVWGFVVAGVFVTPGPPFISAPERGHIWTS